MPRVCHETAKPKSASITDVIDTARSLVMMVVNAAVHEPTELVSVNLWADDAGTIHMRGEFAEAAAPAPVFFDDSNGDLKTLKRCEQCNKVLPMQVTALS